MRVRPKPGLTRPDPWTTHESYLLLTNHNRSTRHRFCARAHTHTQKQKQNKTKHKKQKKKKQKQKKKREREKKIQDKKQTANL